MQAGVKHELTDFSCIKVAAREAFKQCSTSQHTLRASS
jgi:hypothetical protein